MTAPPRAAAFFERKRRLAYHFAWASMGFLALQLCLGFLLQLNSHPRAVAAPEGGFRVVHRLFNQDDFEGSRLLFLDADAKPQAPPITFPDTAAAVLPDGPDLLLFFGNRAALLVGGQITKNIDLGQKWEVMAALADPGGPWIFGWAEDRVVARRREKDKWGDEITVSKSILAERISVSRDAAGGPLVAWRERGSPKVKTAVLEGAAFVPSKEYEIGGVEHWDLFAQGGRQVLLTYNRDDRTQAYVTLRLECCPGCASRLEPRKLRFADPVLLLGRKVTGLSAVPDGDRVRVFITRMSTLMTAATTLASAPSEVPRLLSIGAEPAWRYGVALVVPSAMVFCSLAMIFLGFTLFRERGRVASGIPVPGPQPAEFLQRLMAFSLDIFLLSPVLWLAVELLHVAPEGFFFDPEDPHIFKAVGVMLLGQFLYYFLMEGLLGWTVG